MNAGITKALQSMGGFITKNSPSILTGISVGGLIVTVVLAVKATPKAIHILEQEMYDRKVGSLDLKETVVLVWKCYIPAAIVGTATIGCIIMANSVSLKRNAALVGLISSAEAIAKEYQEKVIEQIGVNKEQKVRDDIAKDHIHAHPVIDKEVILTGKGDTLCYDTISGRYFKNDIEAIRKVLNDVNRDLLSDDFVSINDLYFELGLSNIKMGNLMGWHSDEGLIEPSFSSQLTDAGIPCLVIDYVVEPKYNKK